MNDTNQSDDVNFNKPADNSTFDQDVAELEDKSNTSAIPPNVRGSHSVLGSSPSPDSDDNVLENAHQMGIAKNSDLENPKPLNLAKDIAEAEEYRKKH